MDLGDLKTKTKAGTGCGGCMPLVTPFSTNQKATVIDYLPGNENI